MVGLNAKSEKMVKDVVKGCSGGGGGGQKYVGESLGWSSTKGGGRGMHMADEPVGAHGECGGDLVWGAMVRPVPREEEVMVKKRGERRGR